ncbi:MAG: 16S rRNA (adenine(1518)-N(6)/adenine(1519)-N(6))-dimethyltransferase RsmA [Bacilli bacterium]
MGGNNPPIFIMNAKKNLGQNFLVDNVVIEKITNEINATKNDLIIEIGPGYGALTSILKKTEANIIAYEIDTDLKIYLSKYEDNLTKIIYQDFLKSNIKEDIKNIKYDKLFIIGNLPYYITTPIIEKITKEELIFEKLVIMVQKEVADRFVAINKTKDYGYITLYLKYYYDIKRLMNVSKNSFKPVPKVESTVLLFLQRKDKPNVNKEKYFNFLKECFKQKRKTLRNNVSSKEFEIIKDLLKTSGLNENIRAEEINEDLFIKIVNNI